MSGRARRIGVSAWIVGLDLARNRAAVALLVVVPTVFYLVVAATTGHEPIPFVLDSAGSAPIVADERQVSLLFIGMASVSGVSAFLSFVLLLRPVEADQRLVFEGYRPAELLVAKILVVVAVALLVAAYVTALLVLFFRADRPLGVFAGFVLTSLVYAAVGMLVGALVRRELEGILAILLLVNIDPGWLQSPAFYAHARNQALIRLLPGHHPGQVAMLSAFTHLSAGPEAAAAAAYAVARFGVAGLLYWYRVRVLR
jgi:hypothetical protein